MTDFSQQNETSSASEPRHSGGRCSGVRRSGALEVFMLGCVDFHAATRLQERLLYEVAGGKDDRASLLLCEHPPILTLGREASVRQVRWDQSEFDAMQIETVWHNRGGGACVHAPGQLSILPILPLNRINLGQVAYQKLLDETVQKACLQQKITAWTKPNLPGVWSRGGQIGWTGAAIRFGVSYHGAYLNVSPALDFMRSIKSSDGTTAITSIAAERVKKIAMNEVRESVIQTLASQLGYDRVQIHTRHPLLKRAIKKVPVSIR